MGVEFARPGYSEDHRPCLAPAKWGTAVEVAPLISLRRSATVLKGGACQTEPIKTVTHSATATSTSKRTGRSGVASAAVLCLM